MGAPHRRAPEAPPSAEAVFGDRLPLAVAYADLLATTGIDHGLIGPREAGRLWERHLLNCAALASLVPEGARVIDIGSGAGLPGIVLAIARPDLRVDLVEPLLRRTTWLEQAVTQLGVDDTVAVHRGRADEMSLTAPIVTARAVASLDKLVTWSFPLLEDGGRLLALKGAAAGDELRAAESFLQQQGVRASSLQVLAEEDPAGPVRVVEIVRPAGWRPRTRGVAAGAKSGGRRRGRADERGR